MNANCADIRNKLADCINDRTDPNEDKSLADHLKQCPQCSKYYNELRADDEELNGFAKSMRPVLNKIETNISKELGAAKIRNTFLRSRISRLAVAAVILIGVVLVFTQFGGANAAWAKVSQIILELQTITFDVRTGNGPVVSCTASEKKLKEKLPNGIEAIFDYDQSKILVLNPNDKTAMNIELSGLPILPSNLFNNLKSAIEILQKCPDTIVKRLGKREINNEEIEGIRVYLDKSIDIKIWYRTRDNLPILIEAENMMGQTNAVFSNFNFDAITDESVFSLTIPDGYKEIQSEKMDLESISEQDLIEGLQEWAGLMENKFPEKLDLAIMHKNSQMIEQKLNDDGKSDVDKAIIAIKIIRALMFTQQIQNDWFYNGEGIELGDANSAIFWYRPDESQHYRVLHGDLHIVEVTPENLPKMP